MLSGIQAFLSINQTQATDILDAGFLVAFFSSVLFVIGYSALAPWWTHRVGWSVVMLDITLGLVLTPTVLHLLFNLYTGGLFFTWYRCLSLFAIAAVTLWRLWLVKLAQDDMLRDVTLPGSPVELDVVPEPVEETE